MEIEIIFTAHALLKFEILRRHGIELTLEQVRQIVLAPVSLEEDALGNPIAQGPLDPMHVLRVVYREESDARRIVITFYPGRRERYENQL
jgi:hypothetical protein